MTQDQSVLAYCGLSCMTACPERAYPETCLGCKSAEHLAPFCATCAIRRCAAARGVPTCGHCAEYPTCTVELWQRFPILRTLIDRLRAELSNPPVV